jgi:hypothetical protein
MPQKSKGSQLFYKLRQAKSLQDNLFFEHIVPNRYPINLKSQFMPHNLNHQHKLTAITNQVNKLFFLSCHPLPYHNAKND